MVVVLLEVPRRETLVLAEHRKRLSRPVRPVRNKCAVAPLQQAWYHLLLYRLEKLLLVNVVKNAVELEVYVGCLYVLFSWSVNISS